MANNFQKIAQEGGSVKVLRKSATQVDTEARFNNRSIEPKYNMESLLDIFETDNTARKCIELYAKNVVKAGWEVFPDDPDKAKEGEKERIMDFFNNCNTENSFDYVIKEMVVALMSTGTAAIEIARNPNTMEPKNLYSIPIETLRVLARDSRKTYRSGQRFVQNENLQWSDDAAVYFNRYQPDPSLRSMKNGYYPKLNGENVTNEIMWFRLPNPSSKHYGQSPSITLLRKYLITKYAEEFNIDEFEHGLLSKFMVVVKNGQISQGSLEALTAYMEEIVYQKKWSQIPILNATGEKAEINVEKLNDQVKEGSYIELMKFNREEVYIAFGVPPILLGITDGSQLANQKAQEGKFHNEEIMPIQNELKIPFINLIKKDLGLTNWNFRFKSPDFTDKGVESTITSAAVKDGSMSINEKRSALGLDPILDEKGERDAGADSYNVTTSTGLIPVKDLIKLDSSEFATTVGEEQGKVIVKSLLNLRSSFVSESEEEKIKKGIDGGEINEPYPGIE